MSKPSIDPTSVEAGGASDETGGEETHTAPPSHNAAVAAHADKYNDPRATVTARGIWIGVLVTVLGIVGAIGSIYARKTRLEESTRFWGPDTITAFQLAERIELLPAGGTDFSPVELTATPGLGHLRRTLLDERNYQWDTELDRPALEYCGHDSTGTDGRDSDDDQAAATERAARPPKFTKCLRLRFTDPTAHRFEPIEVDLDLGGGWLGPSDGSRRVQATPYVQPKLQNYFGTIISVEQLRYDLRK